MGQREKLHPKQWIASVPSLFRLYPRLVHFGTTNVCSLLIQPPLTLLLHFSIDDSKRCAIISFLKKLTIFVDLYS